MGLNLEKKKIEIIETDRVELSITGDFEDEVAMFGGVDDSEDDLVDRAQVMYEETEETQNPHGVPITFFVMGLQDPIVRDVADNRIDINPYGEFEYRSVFEDVKGKAKYKVIAEFLEDFEAMKKYTSPGPPIKFIYKKSDVKIEPFGFTHETETNEGTGTGGGGSVGAFEGPFMNPIRRKINEGLNLQKKKDVVLGDADIWITVDYEAPISLRELIKIDNNYRHIEGEEPEYNGDDFEEIRNMAFGETMYLNAGTAIRRVKSENSPYTQHVFANGNWIERSTAVEALMESSLYDEADLYELSDEELVGLYENLIREQELELDDASIIIYNAEDDEQIVVTVTQSGLNNLLDGEWVFNNGRKWVTHYDADVLSERTGDDDDEDLNEGLNLRKKAKKDWTDLPSLDNGTILLPDAEYALSALKDGAEVMVLGYGDDDEEEHMYTGIYYDDYAGESDEEILESIKSYWDFQIWGNNTEINEQKLNMGALKLMEVLTSADIQQIKSLAADEAKREARKTKDELSKDITDLKKTQKEVSGTIDKHVQDKDHHTTEKQVKDIAKTETDKIKQDTDQKIDDKIDKTLNGKELEKKMRTVVADTMVKYHQTLWTKRGFWSNSLTV